ncbi:hypothetical protein Hanom_Chr14g01261641 [Helianthus anomalus]
MLTRSDKPSDPNAHVLSVEVLYYGWPSNPSELYRVKSSSVRKFLKILKLISATDWHPNLNIYCILDESYPNMEPFKVIIPFMKESRIAKALTEKTICYESHLRRFWKSVRYDENEKTIYSAVRLKDEKNKDIDVEIKFTVADVRRF